MADHREPHTIILDPAAPPLVALLSGNSMKRLETDVLPEYLMERRWYRAKNAGIANVRIADFILLGGDDAILLLDVTPADRSAARYLLAATIFWDERGFRLCSVGGTATCLSSRRLGRGLFRRPLYSSADRPNR